MKQFAITFLAVFCAGGLLLGIYFSHEAKAKQLLKNDRELVALIREYEEIELKIANYNLVEWEFHLERIQKLRDLAAELQPLSPEAKTQALKAADLFEDFAADKNPRRKPPPAQNPALKPEPKPTNAFYR